MTDKLQVSEEMIRAGSKAFLNAHPMTANDEEFFTAIYLAMKAAEPLPQGDEVERVARALMAFHGEDEECSNGFGGYVSWKDYEDEARAAITAIGDEAREAEPLPQGDEVERAANIIEDMVEGGSRNYTNIARAAITAIGDEAREAEPLPQGDKAWSPDEICDEAVRLADAQPGDKQALWRAAYHGAMLTRAALVSSPIDRMETCDVCGGAGGDNQHSVCGKCDGAGGYPIGDDVRERVARAIAKRRGEHWFGSNWGSPQNQQWLLDADAAITAMGSQAK